MQEQFFLKKKKNKQVPVLRPSLLIGEYSFQNSFKKMNNKTGVVINRSTLIAVI